jgi:hypothetical protein
MAQFPSNTSAYGVWNMMDVRDAVMGGNWPSTGPLFSYVGTLGTSGADMQLSVPIGGTTIFALRLSSVSFGTSTLYRSTDGGATWVTGGSVAGSGSQYGQGLLALSNTVVIVQNRGYFYRSTDAGDTFTQILATSGGQNNFFTICSDGTNGICAGYNQNVITSNNWVSASAVGRPYGIVMATAALTNNGSNVFLHAPLGSSGSPFTAYIGNAAGSSTITSFSVAGNQSIAASNPTNGFNAFMNIAEGAPSGNVYYATYPGTSYTTANLTGITWGWTGYHAVTSDNKVLCPFSNGLWLVQPGTTPLLVSAFTNFGGVCLDVTGSRNFAIRLTGEVYRYV